VCQLAQGKFGEAEKELREERRLAPDDPEAPERLGQLYLTRDNDFVRATSFWRDARRLEPTPASIRAILGFAYARMGDRAEALAVKLQPEAALAQFNLTLQLGEAGLTNEADQASGRRVPTRVGLAQLLQEPGRLHEAREQYRAFLAHELQPGLGDKARRAIAEINVKLGNE
jgi:Flp pilus assembly protein TadD